MKKWTVNKNRNSDLLIIHRENDLINVHTNNKSYLWFGTINGKEVNGVSKKTSIDELINIINNEKS